MIKIYNYRDDHDYAEFLNKSVQEAFPAQADRARAMMNDLLQRYDRHRWRVFNQQAADRYKDLSSLNVAHAYISQLLCWQDEGETMPEHYIEASLRNLLRLPFKSIDGGHTSGHDQPDKE